MAPVMRTVLLLATMAIAMALAACSKHSAEPVAYGGVAAEAAATGRSGDGEAASFLAYEHHVGIRLAAADIEPRLKAARAACEQARFGGCVVLNVQQQGGDHPSASLGLRIAPAGVEPMIALASEGADVGHRSTRAEDLAVVVRDNDLAQARLRKERERLQEFQARRDLSVADMIALSQRLAETEAQLEDAENQGATHRRRIDTQLLTLNFQPPSGQSNRNDIVLALRESGGILASGVAWTIRALAFLLPLLVLAGIVVMLIRRRRRRRRTGT
jgi:hypothetical protein